MNSNSWLKMGNAAEEKVTLVIEINDTMIINNKEYVVVAINDNHIALVNFDDNSEIVITL